MRFGFTSVTFRNKSAKEICEIALQNGIKYIEWGADVHAKSASDAAEIRALCDGYGIKTVSLGSYFRVGDDDILPFERDCESAEILGAKKIRVWLGRESSISTSAETRAKLISQTRTLADIAEKHGLVLAFEFHKKTYNDSAEKCLEFISDVGKPNVKTYWQPFSFGNDESELALILPELCEVHMFSWDENNVRFPLDAKEREWRIFLDTISDKSQIDFILEFVKDDDDVQFARDVQTAKKLLGI